MRIPKMVENGMVNYTEPKVKYPSCPVCGEECETYYFDKYGDIIGCDQCVITGNAWEYIDEHEEAVCF